MTAQYNYLATDLVSNTILGELPVNNVALDCQLNSAGNMSSGMKLSDPRIDDDELIARTEPGKTAFWAYRENQIVWGGIVLSREYQSNGKSLTLTGQTFECYASRRYPRSVLGASGVLNLSLGMCETVDYLWSHLQSISGGSIGVQAAQLPLVDNPTSLTVNGYDLSISYGDLIASITQLSNGPDWTIGWAEDQNGLPLKQLVTGIPIGQQVAATDLVVDYPGPVANYTYTENSSSGSNYWWATGDGEGAAQAAGVAIDEATLSSGYPIWEHVNNYSGVTSQTTIDAHAASDLKQKGMPMVTHSARFHATAFPTFGSYQMGDYAIVNVTDPRFPKGKTFIVRVIGWSIQPPDESQGTEIITPVFDEPSAN